MGQPAVQQAGETTDAAMKAYVANAPALLQSLQGQILPQGQAELAAQQQLAPGQEQLQLDQYKNFAPEFAKVGSDIAAQNQNNQAANTTSALANNGVALGNAMQTADKSVNAPWYQARDNSVDQLNKLFGSLQDPNGGMSGSELAEISRGQAQTDQGNGITSPTASSTLSNAMQFGEAGQKLKMAKQQAIGNALGTATGLMPTIKSSLDPSGAITGTPVSNFGNANSPNQLPNVGETSNNVGMDAFAAANNAAMQYNQINSTRPNSIIQAFGAMPSCCFIFMQAYDGVIPWFVRYSRDFHYTEDIRRGYVLMSKILVPLMDKFEFIRDLVREVMIKPMTEHAGGLFGVHGYEGCRVMNEGRKKFWLKTWELIGKWTPKLVKYGKCKGIAIRTGKQTQVELWKIPAMSSVPTHKHEGMDSLIIPIKGSGLLYINEIETLKLSKLFKRYFVPSTAEHGIMTIKSSFWFLNFQKWNTSNVTSASTNFQKV